jgi:hypothetical protein
MEALFIVDLGEVDASLKSQENSGDGAISGIRLPYAPVLRIDGRTSWRTQRSKRLATGLRLAIPTNVAHHHTRRNADGQRG